jgi:hypothetical protein
MLKERLKGTWIWWSHYVVILNIRKHHTLCSPNYGENSDQLLVIVLWPGDQWDVRCSCRIWRILTMVYNTHNYWVSGLCSLSRILGTIKTTFWKLDLCPSSGEGRKTPAVLSPLERSNLNHWTELDWNVVFSSIQNSGRWTKSRNPVILKMQLIEHFKRRNGLARFSFAFVGRRHAVSSHVFLLIVYRVWMQRQAWQHSFRARANNNSR